MALAANVQRAFTDGGAKTVITRGLKKLARPACKFGTLVFAECDLTRPLPVPRPAPGILAREATIEDAVLFEDRNLFLERLEAGDRCFVGIEQETGRLTNYRWVTTLRSLVPELNRYVIVKPGEAYAYDLVTLPEFRKRGIDSFTRHYTYSYLRDSGFIKIYNYIHGDNNPSLRASSRFLKEIGRIWYIQLRGCEPLMIGGRRPEFPELRRL